MQRARSFDYNLGFVKADDNRNNARAATRLKNINLTKLNASYERYLKTVPREYRSAKLSDSWHPVTPDHRSKSSISQWNRDIAAWRKRVYLWNTITDEQCDALTQAVKSGDVGQFLSYCTTKEAPVTAPGGHSYRNLLDPKISRVKIEPILFKPTWFSGEIIHSGCCTVEEDTFLHLASDVYQHSDEHFKQFYEDYIQSYTDRSIG